jgi:signal transduction histidine kinase
VPIVKQLWQGAPADALESLAELVASVEAPMAVVDAAGVVRGASASLARGLGYATACQLLGRSADDLAAGFGRRAVPDGRVSDLTRACGGVRRARERTAHVGDATLVSVEWDESTPSAVAALAHDLRSPLCGVIGFARLASEELARGNTTRAAALLERVQRSAGTLAALVQAAADSPAHQTADLVRVVEEVRAERKHDFERKRARLEAPADAPRLACPPASLYRVLSNLIGNALDHMGDPPDAAIRVSVRCAGDFATLTVRDNGIGIASHECERVFTAGHSGARDAGEHPRGLGLAIVRDLAASWGGRAWAESAPAAGAALHVTIPLAS